MRCLPALPAPFDEFQLPLADATAELLILAVFERSTDERLELLLIILKSDPAIAVWSALQSPFDTVPTPAQISIQLDERLPGCFSEVTEWCSDAIDQSLLDEIIELTGDSLCVAEENAGPAEDETRANTGMLYLTGLVHNARQWLSLMASNADELREIRLPNWLDEIPRSDASKSEGNYAETARAWWTRQSPLAASLPEICRRLNQFDRLQTQLSAELEDQKLQAMYKLAAGAGHEINNPLGSIAGRAQLLLRDETDPERRRTLAKINTQAFRAHEMIADMMLFAKPPALSKQQVNLVRLIDQVLEELNGTAEERQTRLINMTAAETILIEADETQLLVVLQALCKNALEALGAGGHIEVAVRSLGDASHPTGAKITVRDDGPGVLPEQRPHLFDPFYSGREAGRGLGFGLSKCWRIIKNHGGELTVESSPGHGATFTVSLPAA
jgi:hypothetical protein